MIGIVVAATLLFAPASAGPCDGHLAMRDLVGVSPRCFEECAGLCSGMGRLLATRGGGAGDVRAAVCAARQPLECAGAAGECASVLVAASELLGVTLAAKRRQVTALCDGEQEGEEDDTSEGNTTTALLRRLKDEGKDDTSDENTTASLLRRLEDEVEGEFSDGNATAELLRLLREDDASDGNTTAAPTRALRGEVEDEASDGNATAALTTRRSTTTTTIMIRARSLLEAGQQVGGDSGMLADHRRFDIHV